MKIIRGYVYTEEGFVQKDIYIGGQVLQKEAEADDSDTIDAEGCYIIPGLTDIHFHGCVGYDFCDGSMEAMEAIGAYQASVGVTTIMPATMTLPEKELFKICGAAAAYAEQQRAAEMEAVAESRMRNVEGNRLASQGKKENASAKEATFCGINLEGPFVSGEKLGAQNPAYLQKPNQELFERLQQESGDLIKMVDIAPELSGAMEFIRKNSGQVVISLAHTAAGYDTAMEAFDAGADHVTHLFNAMNPLRHREPGVIGAAADAGAYVELICDGVHVHPAAVRGVLKLFGEDRIIFISDSMMATGLTDGDYSLGGQPVKVVGRKAFLKDGTIAGSVTNLMECMRRAVLEMQIPLETAVKCAAVNPAKHMGLYEKYGSITPGKIANLVLLDRESLEVKRVIINGTPI